MNKFFLQYFVLNDIVLWSFFELESLSRKECYVQEPSIHLHDPANEMKMKVHEDA